MATLTDHPAYAALHAAVLDHPEDDLVRLALADWLDENGGESWFLRGQIALERECRACLRDGQDNNYPDGRAYRPRCRCAHCTLGRKVQAEAFERAKCFRDAMKRAATGAWWKAEQRSQADRFRGGHHSLRDEWQAWRDVVVGTIPDVRPLFRRGFVHTLTCNPSFARHGLRAALEQHPVQEVVAHNPSLFVTRFVIARSECGWTVAYTPPPLRAVRVDEYATRAKLVDGVCELARNFFPPPA